MQDFGRWNFRCGSAAMIFAIVEEDMRPKYFENAILGNVSEEVCLVQPHIPSFQSPKGPFPGFDVTGSHQCNADSYLWLFRSLQRANQPKDRSERAVGQRPLGILAFVFKILFGPLFFVDSIS